MLFGCLLEQKRTLLLESVDASIAMAREQVLRSSQIVSRSHKIVDRTRLALARANRIRHGLIGPARNPMVPPSGGKMTVREI